MCLTFRANLCVHEPCDPTQVYFEPEIGLWLSRLGSVCAALPLLSTCFSLWTSVRGLFVASCLSADNVISKEVTALWEGESVS